MRRLGANALLLIAAAGLSRLSSLFVFGLVAHRLGAQALGVFGLCTAITSYWFFLTDMGLSQRLVREGAADPTGLQTDFAASLNLKLAGLALPGLTVVVALLGWGNRAEIQLFVLLTIAASLQSLAYTYECAARAHELNKVEAISATAQVLVFGGLSVVLLELGRGIVALGLAAAAGSLLRLLISAALAGHWVNARPARIWRPRLLRSSAPYLTTSLTLTAYVGVDVLIIGLLADTDFVGRYIAVSRPLLALVFLVNYAAQAVIPGAVRTYIAGGERFFRAGQRVLLMVMLMGGLAAAVLAGLAEPLLRILYGSSFADAEGMLQLAALYLPLAAGTAVLGVLATAADRQGERAVAVIVGLAATGVFCLALVPTLGETGAVLQLLGSELVLLTALLWRLQRVTAASAGSYLSVLGLGCIGVAAALFALVHGLGGSDALAAAGSAALLVVVLIAAAPRRASRAAGVTV